MCPGSARGSMRCSDMALEREPFKGFWKRLQMFVQEVKVNDPMSEEEKEMILRVARKNL